MSHEDADFVAALGRIGRARVIVWFGVLGPLQVRDNDSVLSVPAARQQVLLAALLVRAGTVVSADALAELMWDGTPPDGASITLRSHVMRLRRALGPTAGARVVTRFPGYLIEADQEEVDLLRFTGLCREGGAAVRAGAWARAAAALDEALGLWRGVPLADIHSELLRRDELPRLEQLRLQAVEWRMDARLQLGDHAELVPELRALTAEHPLRERFAAQLMLALVRCGRQAEALDDYQRARTTLVEALGTEPGAELRELHQRILTGDPSLAEPKPVPPAAGSPQPITPRELPAPVAHFSGRSGELALLTGLLDRSGGQAVVISAIGGTAGVGKTALALQWAHQVVGRFPDGQLHVNLRGYDPGPPMTAADALAGFLRALGVPGQDIPAEEGERAARYRSLLASKRMLVVLDNAATVEQVRTLLPGSPACAVVITSRDSLAGLIARDGATRLDLDLLPLADAVSLLRALIGGRVDDDAGATRKLAEQCCRLPLALRVAAELAAARPAAPLGDLAGELADERRRLDLLEAGGDPRTAVRAVFSWSYRDLDADAARVFRLIGLHPGPDFEPYAAVALTGTDLDRTRRALGTLGRAHLIQSTAPGRYGMHDLLRDYARELAAQDGEQEQRAALTRLFDHYLYTASVAINTLYPADLQERPRILRPAVSGPPLTTPATALRWLDDQRASLVAVAGHAAAHGWARHIDALAATLRRYLNVGGYCAEALTIHGHARRAARQAGDRAAEGRALMALGVTHVQQGLCEEATTFLEQALEVFTDTKDRAGQARALYDLGLAAYYRGRYQDAVGHLVRALAIFRDEGNQNSQGSVLMLLGGCDERRGRNAQAANHHRQALALYRAAGNRTGEGNALGNLGLVEERLGHYARAADYQRQSLAISRETGSRIGEVHALGNLGRLELRQGNFTRASEHHSEALDLSRETGDQVAEAEALNGLGEVMLAMGLPGNARTHHVAAVRLASQIGAKHEQADAHDGLARACDALGDQDQARAHWQQALVLYTELDAPEADQVRAQLAAVDSGRRINAT